MSLTWAVSAQLLQAAYLRVAHEPGDAPFDEKLNQAWLKTWEDYQRVSAQVAKALQGQ